MEEAAGPAGEDAARARARTPSVHSDAGIRLPGDWQRVYSKSTGNYYYYNWCAPGACALQLLAPGLRDGTCVTLSGTQPYRP